MLVGIDAVIGVGLGGGGRRGGLERGLAIGQLDLFAHLLIGHVIHRDLGLGRVLLLFLALLGCTFAVILALVVLAGAVGVFLFLAVVLGLGFLVFVEL